VPVVSVVGCPDSSIAVPLHHTIIYRRYVRKTPRTTEATVEREWLFYVL
jgi:hypothetical protein